LDSKNEHFAFFCSTLSLRYAKCLLFSLPHPSFFFFFLVTLGTDAHSQLLERVIALIAGADDLRLLFGDGPFRGRLEALALHILLSFTSRTENQDANWHDFCVSGSDLEF
jgi:hypothetical protein